jgi:hypothetical protein
MECVVVVEVHDDLTHKKLMDIIPLIGYRTFKMEYFDWCWGISAHLSRLKRS